MNKEKGIFIGITNNVNPVFKDYKKDNIENSFVMGTVGKGMDFSFKRKNFK